MIQQFVFPYLGKNDSLYEVFCVTSLVVTSIVVVPASALKSSSCTRETYSTISISVFAKWRLAVCKLPSTEVASEQCFLIRCLECPNV